MRARVSALMALGLLGCASPGPPQPPFANGPECLALVARHAADPSLPVDTPAEARTLRVAPLPKGTYTFRFVVAESGRTTPDDVSIVPNPTGGADGRHILASSTFVPARAGECWVSSVFTYSAIIG